MTGIELGQWLRESGTGEAKMAVVLGVLRENRKAPPGDIVLALRDAGHEMTAVKAGQIVALGGWDAETFRLPDAAEADELKLLLKAPPGTKAVKVAADSKPVRDRHDEDKTAKDKEAGGKATT